MTVSFEPINELSSERVAFYTARLGKESLTEFEKFVAGDYSNHLKEIEILYTTLGEMKTRGAKSYYFKDEREALALPKVSYEVMAANKKDFGVRLYCIRLDESNVILLNGDIKTKKTAQECPNVKDHFRIANKIATALNKALSDEENTMSWVDLKLNI